LPSLLRKERPILDMKCIILAHPITPTVPLSVVIVASGLELIGGKELSEIEVDLLIMRWFGVSLTPHNLFTTSEFFFSPNCCLVDIVAPQTRMGVRVTSIAVLQTAFEL